MSYLMDASFADMASRIGWTLLHSLWQCAVVAQHSTRHLHRCMVCLLAKPTDEVFAKDNGVGIQPSPYGSS
jgi:hypothetical protein